MQKFVHANVVLSSCKSQAINNYNYSAWNPVVVYRLLSTIYETDFYNLHSYTEFKYDILVSSYDNSHRNNDIVISWQVLFTMEVYYTKSSIHNC
jgi:hypothetical protein